MSIDAITSQIKAGSFTLPNEQKNSSWWYRHDDRREVVVNLNESENNFHYALNVFVKDHDDQIDVVETKKFSGKILDVVVTDKQVVLKTATGDLTITARETPISFCLSLD